MSGVASTDPLHVYHGERPPFPTLLQRSLEARGFRGDAPEVAVNTTYLQPRADSRAPATLARPGPPQPATTAPLPPTGSVPANVATPIAAGGAYRATPAGDLGHVTTDVQTIPITITPPTPSNGTQ